MQKLKILAMSMLVLVSVTAILSIDFEYCRADLHRFGSYEELKQFMRYREQNHPQDRFSYSTRPGMKAESLNAMGALDFSGTNIQVEGVDEADIVKTDGEYIYVIAGQKVVIVKAYPVEEAAVLSRITVNGTLEQLFINSEKLVIIYTDNSWTEPTTFARIYDVSERGNPLLKREIAVDGFYFSSRMIGDYAYVVTRKGTQLVDDEVALPKIRCGNDSKIVSATEVYYSDIVEWGYSVTMIVSVNLHEDGTAPAYSPVLLGWASTIYFSLDNIYIAIADGQSTALHRIHVKKGEIIYDASGEVPGTILNQFSMDEHEGYFRIATTSAVRSPNQGNWMLNQQNNVYVLDMNLAVAGRLENLAAGEQIHSTRFVGSLCYLVTFRKIDPLFVIKLSDPHNPEVLGELKVTGYSDYLHLYDENHIIGVGKETVADDSDLFSWYQGVKISLFDVTELSDPVELAKYEIGDRGTDSPVLREHKAFLFDKDKNLLVLPVSVARINESQYPDGVPPYAYGELEWQGAYVFNISLEIEARLTLKGTITHVENGDVRDSSQHVSRVLYIGEALYTISNHKIKMNSLTDLSVIGELSLN